MNKHISFILACFLGLSSAAQISTAYVPDKVDPDTVEAHELREVRNGAFRVGEKLTYTIHFGWLDAGEAVMEVQESPYKFGERDAYRIVGTGKSLGGFDWFYRVRDHYETYLDKDGLFPHYFVRNCDEGGYKINQKYRFFPKKSVVATHEGDTLLTPNFVQDMLSSYYYMRALDYSEAEHGDVFEVLTLVDGEVFPLKIKYQGKETIKTRKGKFR